MFQWGMNERMEEMLVGEKMSYRDHGKILLHLCNLYDVWYGIFYALRAPLHTFPRLHPIIGNSFPANLLKLSHLNTIACPNDDRTCSLFWLEETPFAPAYVPTSLSSSNPFSSLPTHKTVRAIVTCCNLLLALWDVVLANEVPMMT